MFSNGIGTKRTIQATPLTPWSVSWFALLFLSKQAPSSPLLTLLDLHVIQTRMIPAEGTPTLKSDLVFDTRYFEYCIMTYLVLRFCVYLYDCDRSFLLEQVRELGHI